MPRGKKSRTKFQVFELAHYPRAFALASSRQLVVSKDGAKCWGPIAVAMLPTLNRLWPEISAFGFGSGLVTISDRAILEFFAHEPVRHFEDKRILALPRDNLHSDRAPGAVFKNRNRTARES